MLEEGSLYTSQGTGISVHRQLKIGSQLEFIFDQEFLGALS